MIGMQEYVSPLVDERLVNPGNDFISVLASGEKAGIFNREQVLVNTSLLLLAGHETTINLLCNGSLAFIQHPDQWDRLKTGQRRNHTTAAQPGNRGVPALRCAREVHSTHRLGKTWKCGAK